MLFQFQGKTGEGLNMIFAFKNETPRIDPSAFVAETAAVVGDVTVERDASVWFGAVVRGDNEPIVIGAGTNIQDNATLHCDPGCPLRIGRNVTVGHHAVVHCAAVGDNTLVGMGAMLLTGAVIGKNCVIGAGAVVRENEVVPDGVLMVGVPAKAVRRLSPGQIAAMEQESHYVALAKNYKT